MIINFRNLMCGGGGKPAVIEALSVTENGSYTPAEGTDGYAPVEVNVQPALQEKTATTNGEVIADTEFYGLSKVNVQVPIPTFTTEELTATENKVYTPTTDGYSKVTVNVPEKVFSTEEKTVSIVENGQTIVEKSADKDGMTKVTVDVNVPAPQPVLETLSVTANGSYTPGAGVDGYSKVNVNVAGGASAGSVDFGIIGYDNETAYVKQLNADLAYSKQKYDEWEAKPDKTTADSLYSGDKKLVYAPQIDTSKVTGAYNMFGGCSSLSIVPILDLSSCNECIAMFEGCERLQEVPLIDLSNVASMNSAFSGCKSLTTVPPFDLSSCTACDSMFYGCDSLVTVPSFDLSSCTTCASMFYSCDNFEVFPSNLTTSKVETMFNMFSAGGKIKEIGELDCSSVQVGQMFDLDYYYKNIEKLGGFKNLKVSINISGVSYGKLDKLDKQSAMNVINDLGQADPAFEAQPKLTFCSKVYALLAPDDIAIATGKGWTVVDAGF